MALRLHQLKLGWLTPPAPTVDGTMALVDHLKELRYRVVISAIAIVLMTAIGLVFHKDLTKVVMWPIDTAIESYKRSNPGAQSEVIIKELTGGFMFMLKIAGVAGLIASCPVWLYQFWAFIVPGLLANEKKYAVRFLGSAIPLFLMGVALGYIVTPKGFAVLLNFNPEGILNLNDLNTFLAFELRMLLVFGLSFLLPVVLVALNMIGVVKATQLARARSVAVFSCFVFAAIATPSVDPFAMLALALPMVLMYLVSELICKAHDKAVASRSDEIVLADDRVSVD
ncbi:twin-arginine translocase subunit TatC [Aestuariimicrobium ganziense]|uniref:twin-arginine translocase subunit TatC n=1 Tax=Aestuariimicrobium ganziense TaxID=2773677 RepID=UPI00194155A3|nr:twin-arginine translocase subunit TatC [Aestuariimicrobium ganziense]